jgi:hypothetical protein
MMNGPAMQPPMSLSHPAPGDLVALWVDPDLSWVDISKTEIYAVSLGHEGLAQPAHTDSGLKDPAAMADRQRLVGAGILSLAALIVGLGYVGTNFAAGSQGNVRRRHSQEGRRRIEDWPGSTLVSSDWSARRRDDTRDKSAFVTILLTVDLKAMAGSTGQVWQQAWLTSARRFRLHFIAS